MPTKSAKTLSKNELFNEIRKAEITEIAHKLKDCSTDGGKKANEARFAVFLGAGASIQAGIKTAGQMINEFKDKILRDCPKTAVLEKDKDKWLEDRILNNGKGNEYSKLFEAFERTQSGRQRYIAKLVKDKEPSFGYAMLASLIARGFVSTILTTNFDDLVFMGCTKFSGIRPVIYSYGILATEMKFASPHPKILKMHGDYLYSALANTESEMSQFNQDPNMQAQVTACLNEYELIVFGYGGNDDSVMKILEQYPSGKEFYWCYRDGSKPNERVLKLIASKNGSLVKIKSFDEAMYELYKIVGFELDQVLGSYELRRKEVLDYIDDFDKKYPTTIIEESLDVIKQSSPMVENEPSAWFEFVREGSFAADAGDPVKAEKMYRQAIKLKPDSYAAYHYLGILFFLYGGEIDEAEKMFLKSIELKPDFARAYANLGNLLIFEGKNDQALEYLTKALTLDKEAGLFSLAALHKKLGNTAKSKAFIAKIRAATPEPVYYDLACINSLLDNNEEALKNLELAVREKPYLQRYAKVSASLEPLRNDPRFTKLVGE